ncbi:MAG TPA: Wzz/FepE/Etk N-terminal domain-containing protein [Anaerolineales bacterium]
MDSSEFSVYDHFNRTLSRWWLVALLAIIGGVFGLIFYQLHPSVYEATATYLVNIDLDRFPLQGMQEDLIQYNEDLAVNTTQSVLLSNDVVDGVVRQAKIAGITVTSSDLLKNYTIERKQETWELRYRSQNPQEAQLIVNIWADIGYQAMISWRTAGSAPNYVLFHTPTKAELPQEAVFYDRNKVILAGILIGFIAGILLSNLARWPMDWSHSNQ